MPATSPLLRSLILLLLSCLSLLSLVSSQVPADATFIRIGPSLTNPPAIWPPPREKANAEFIPLTSTFYDGNTDLTVTLSNYAILYGGETPAAAVMNDVWATTNGVTWSWVAGRVGGLLHGRSPNTFPLRSEVAHCQDTKYTQYRAAGRSSTAMFNDGQRPTCIER